MRKKTIVTAVIVLVLIMLIPIKTELKDGGTVSYSAILYGITKRHSMHIKDGVNGYDIGIEVRILFFEVYNDVKFVPNK